LGGLARAAGHENDVWVRDVHEARLRLEGERAALVGDAARRVGDEDDFGIRQVDKDLVRADGVERGEPVKQRDRDLTVGARGRCPG